MSLRDALERALDSAESGDTVQAEHDGATAEVDVAEVDGLGVRIRGLTVRRSAPYDPDSVADSWPRELRALPERLVPVEVDPGLGGATLCSDPDEIRDHTWTEVEVRGAEARVRRIRRPPGGEREERDWTATRDQLGRTVDDLLRGGSTTEPATTD